MKANYYDLTKDQHRHTHVVGKLRMAFPGS